MLRKPLTCMMLLTSCLSGTVSLHEDGMVNIEELVRALESEPLGEMGTLHEIFDLGQPAIPFLAKNLTSKHVYRGSCGHMARESSYLLEGQDPLPAPVPRPTIGDTSLYLIIAILEQDFYFADTCRIAVGTDNSESSFKALSAIQSFLLGKFPLEEHGSMRKPIRRLMRESSIRFLGDRYEMR